MTMTTVSFKPVAITSEQQHYQDVYKPSEYRGFHIYRSPGLMLYYIRDQFGREETGLHGQYTKAEICKMRIDDFYDRKKEVNEKEVKDDKTHT